MLRLLRQVDADRIVVMNRRAGLLHEPEHHHSEPLRGENRRMKRR
jgi:hypothetical protein